MKISIQDIQGNPAGELEVQFEVIESGKGTQAVHDEVTAYRAGIRSGNHATKRVGEVAGTNKKPWRQKGTGRARAGSVRSPLWRGGGVTHGPQPRDYSKKVNKKVSQLALRKALSERLNAGDIIVVDSLKLESPKTKGFVALRKGLGLEGTCLFVVGETDTNVVLASRNVPGVGLVSGSAVNTYELLQYDKLVFTQEAFSKLEERLSKKGQEPE
jgi:large subunit ribosomal protein L4